MDPKGDHLRQSHNRHDALLLQVVLQTLAMPRHCCHECCAQHAQPRGTRERKLKGGTTTGAVALGCTPVKSQN